MKSKISTFISLSMLLAVSFASEQRIASLGGNAGFWAEDDQNIYMFPATINNFNIAQIDGMVKMQKHLSYLVKVQSMAFSWTKVQIICLMLHMVLVHGVCF